MVEVWLCILSHAGGAAAGHQGGVAAALPRAAGLAPRPMEGAEKKRAGVPLTLEAVLTAALSLPLWEVRAAMVNVGALLAVVAWTSQPLLLAHVDGLHVFGMELPLGSSPARAVGQWAAVLGAAGLLTLPLGAYARAAELVALPLGDQPEERYVCRTPARRIAALSSGVIFAWCTLTALAGCPASDVAARAFAGIGGHAHGVGQLSSEVTVNAGVPAPSFSFGRMPLESISKTHSVDPGLHPPGWKALRQQILANQILHDSLVDADNADYHAWAGRILPPDAGEIPPDLLEELPSFEVEELDLLPYADPYVPVQQTRLPRQPQQSMEPLPHCVKSPFEFIENRWKRRDAERFFAE